MTVFTGTTVHDDFDGTAGRDVFDLYQGGDDDASGDAGRDVFHMRGALSAGDVLDGGGDYDSLVLKGDYSTPFAFGAATMVGIESLRLIGGFDYNLVMNDANVAAGEGLNVRATSGVNSLVFDGSAETDGRFRIQDSSGNDDLTGGARHDTFALGGGEDIAHGRGGNDTFALGDSLDALDQIDGGAGFDRADVIGLGGADLLTFSATTMTNIELIRFGFGDYSITTNDATVAAGETLVVRFGPGAKNFNGAAETDGAFTVHGNTGANVFTGGDGADFLEGSSGADTLAGGAGADLLHGDDGADSLTGGAGADEISLGFDSDVDTVVYAAASESTGASGHDSLVFFDADEDKIDVATAVTAFAGEFSDGSSDFETAMNAGTHAAGNAWTVSASGFGFHVFVVIDQNGDGAYADGDDIVIDVTNVSSGTWDVGDFI